jgi:hypothetical protein
MNAIASAIQHWLNASWAAWNRFWFRPAQPHTLALVRILGGLMLLYTHFVWTINQALFLGRDSWINAQAAAQLNTAPDGSNYTWSYLYYVDSPWLLTLLNFGACLVFLMLTLGWQTRIMSVLGFLITLAYCHRLTQSTFGLDQINAVIATYLMIGRSGDVWSLDRWLAERGGDAPPIPPAASTNIAIRLIQLHLCVIYLFGGIGKARGEAWWDGSACWLAIANLEYRSFDLTWLGEHRWFIALLTHVTVFWEVFYCFFIWPKLTRPICLGLAVAVHLGIAIFLGMPTFGLAMIVANLAFVYPETIAAVVGLQWLRAEPRDAAPVVSKGKSLARKMQSPARDTAVEVTPRVQNQWTR